MNKSNKPNIILVLCDDLGYGDIGCYGSSRSKTPILDQMAMNGIRMTDFHVVSPVCSPSRAGIMTGCYPQRVGLGRGEHFCVLLPGDPIGISKDETIIPEVLKKAGYATQMIGKWHLGDQPEFFPTNHGFDHFFGLPYSNDMCHYHPALNVKFPPLPLMEDEAVVDKDPSQGSLNEKYIHEAVNFIQNHSHQPFFLYLAHMYVHWPFYPPKAFLQNADGDRYKAEVEFIDWGMGQIQDTLRSNGLLENTLIVFMSDNGGVLQFGSNGHLRGQKGGIYEGGMRVPCIVSWPSVIQAGHTIDALTTAMDLLPTFAKFAGVELHLEKKIDGEDISKLWLEGTKSASERTLGYYHENRLLAIRKGDWKFVIPSNELFNLKTDESERINLVAQHPEIVLELSRLAEQFRSELGDGDRIGYGVRTPGRVESPTLLFPMEMDACLTAEYE
jgi:arylsulfatase A-like enzyme